MNLERPSPETKPAKCGRPSVCVLMSLYNGTRYLTEQLESIAAQVEVDVFLLARDDGSSDATPDMFVAECTRLGLAHRLITGANLGPAFSFLELVEQAPGKFDGYALCDQDDVWIEDKLSRAMTMLAELAAVPALYCTRHYVTDGNLEVTDVSDRYSHPDFGNALVQNIVTGAGCVMNAAAHRVVKSVGRPRQIVMHDWWFYLLIASAGTVIYDSEPKFFYRQHGGNVVGAGMSGWRKWKKRLAGYLKAKVRSSDQVRALLEASGSVLREEDRQLALRFVEARPRFVRRLALAVQPAIWRQSRIDDLVMRMLIVLGRY